MCIIYISKPQLRVHYYIIYIFYIIISCCSMNSIYVHMQMIIQKYIGHFQYPIFIARSTVFKIWFCGIWIKSDSK